MKKTMGFAGFIVTLFSCALLARSHHHQEGFDISSCRVQLLCDGGSSPSYPHDHNDNHEYHHAGCPKTIFKFPREGQTSDWIRVKVPIPRITALTICAWLTPLTPSGIKGGYVSYATSKAMNNEFLLHFNDRSTLHVCMRNECENQRISIIAKTHFCVTASPVQGWSKTYVNGRMLSQLTYTSRQPIEGGGAFLIGQEQDDFMGSLDSNQAFGGTIENFMMWYRVLEDGEIQALYNDHCNCPGNSSISLEPDQIQVEGKVAQLPTEQC